MISKTKVGALLFLLLAVGYGWTAAHIPLDFWSQAEVFNARSLPLAIATASALIALLILATGPSDQGWGMLAGLRWRPVLALVILMVLYGLALEALGFAIATTLFLVGGYLVMGERRPARLFAASVPLVLLFWLLMAQLGIHLDQGTLIHALSGS